MGRLQAGAENFLVDTQPREAPDPGNGHSGRLAQRPALLLGLGNVLLTDDGVGVHVLRALQTDPTLGSAPPGIRLCDGGTLGLGLLTELENVDSLIVIDAMRFGATPGSVRVFVDGQMDEQLRGARRSVHELALTDLIAAAQLTERAPARRALVGIEPDSLDWGTEPTSAVQAAIPRACAAVRELLTDWGECDARR
jgi:hydrogenase maturation protease